MSHDDFDFEPVRGLPADLPKGEELLWQGAPDWKSLAVRAYHVRKVAAYFGILVACRVGYGLYHGHTTADMGISCLVLLVSGSIAIGVLSLLAYLNARSTVYSITSRRVILRHGVAVPLTMTIPFRLIDAAQLKSYGDKTGDIALSLPATERVGYLITWPHVRAGKITRTQPSFRSLADSQKAAQILGAALANDAGTQAVRLELPTAAPVPAAVPAAAPVGTPLGGTRPRAADPQPAGPRTAATA